LGHGDFSLASPLEVLERRRRYGCSAGEAVLLPALVTPNEGRRSCCQHGTTRARARAQLTARGQLLREIYTLVADHTADVCAHLRLDGQRAPRSSDCTGLDQNRELGFVRPPAPRSFVWLHARCVCKKPWKAGAASLAETKAPKPRGRSWHPDLRFLTSLLL